MSSPTPTAPATPTRVTLTVDGLRIHELTVTDPEVVNGARRHPGQRTTRGGAPSTGSHDIDTQDTDDQTADDRATGEPLAAYVSTALAVGARALAVAGTGLDLASLDRSVATLTHKVDASTNRALAQLTAAVTAATDPTTGAIPRTVATTLDGLAEHVSALLTGHDAPVRTAVAETVRTVTDQALGEIQRAVAAQADTVRAVLATEAPGSPLHDLKTGLVDGLNESHRRLAGQLAELRTALEVDKAKTVAAAKSPQHGIHYEAAALACLEKLTHAAADQLETTGTVPGVIPRCLKGDAVITLTPPPGHRSPPVRVVVELKDRDRPKSLAAWRTLLEEARENRQAVAALGIVKTPSQMPGQRRLHVLDPTNYLLAYDPAVDDQDLLVAAYHLLRTQAWLTSLHSDTGHAVDLPALRGRLADLTSALDGFDGLTRHHNAARRSIDQADQGLAALRADLRNRSEVLHQLLHPTAADNAA